MEWKIFGAPQPGVSYSARPGAYGIAFDGQGRAALVLVENSVRVLLGGGIEAGESEDDCLRREIMEEIGYSAVVREKVCVGEEYTFTRRSGRPFHPIGHIYLVDFGEKLAEGEEGHELIWLPVEECREKMALPYQAWAVETAWKVYHKRKEEIQ